MARNVVERLFTSKNRVKILGYLFFKKSSGNIREIARRLKVAPSVVKREVDNLMGIGLVKRDGGKVFLNNECNYVSDLKNILIKTDYIVEPIKSVLSGLKLDFVVLYGSYVKGNFNEESDVDLLVIGDEKPEVVYKKIAKVEDEFGKDVNVSVWRLGDLKKKRAVGFVKDLNKNKIMIMGGRDEFEKIVG